LQPKDVKGRGAIIKHWLSVYTVGRHRSYAVSTC
jgi:hypothetical protein